MATIRHYPLSLQKACGHSGGNGPRFVLARVHRQESPRIVNLWLASAQARSTRAALSTLAAYAVAAEPQQSYPEIG